VSTYDLRGIKPILRFQPILSSKRHDGPSVYFRYLSLHHNFPLIQVGISLAPELLRNNELCLRRLGNCDPTRRIAVRPWVA